MIGGRSVLADPPYRRRTNMIFQHLALFPHLTVAENIAFGLEMKNAARAKIREKVESALELVRLPGFGSRRIDALSGGQKQRVAMARALVNEPDVLLLDEPLGALDLRLRLQMQEELRRLHRATRNTFIFVTHDQGEAMTMSDRIAVMTTGQIAQVGTPREVYEQPAKRFVAEFIGNSNLLIGTIVNQDTNGNARAAVGELSVACRTSENFRIGEQVTIVLRYEKVEVVPMSAAQLSDDLEGKLVSETFMGSAVRYEIATDRGPILISDMPNSGKTADLQPGARVRIRWPIGSTVVLAE
jgi:spermidine/putrescine transport system ATP-binding protein